jgi:hypothetical protein
VKGRYPLDALRQIRKNAVDERVRDVAEHAAGTERARAEAARARQRREVGEASLEAGQAAERERLEAGGARAADLQAEGSWEAAERARVEAARAKELEAAQATAARAAEELAARGRLALAEAEAKAIDRHRDGWQSERARVQELDEEEQAAEGWSAKNGAPGKRR